MREGDPHQSNQFELPPAAREVFRQIGYGCMAIEGAAGIFHACHAPDGAIVGFRGAPVAYQWQLVYMPTAPLVRLVVHVYDRPQQPFQFESFLNVGEGDQLQVLADLAGQDRLYLAFYGDDLRHRFTAMVPHDAQQWQRLDDIINAAEAYWHGLPPGRRDFDRAKAQFMQQTS